MPPATEEPTLTRGHKKKARTRRQLIAAAVDVIGERGEAFAISDVATRAGMSHGTFYNYFTDRDELIDAVVPEVLGTFAAWSAVAVGVEDPAVRFAAISALALDAAASSPDAIRVVLRLSAMRRGMIDDEITGHLRDDLRLGITSGRFTLADERAALDVIVGSLLLAARRIVDDEAEPGYDANVIDQLLRSLGIAPGEAAAIARAGVLAARRTDQPGPETS